MRNTGSSSLGTPHIVVIDDDREMRSLLRDFLTQHDYRVTEFDLASKALEALIGEKRGSLGEFDLIISDIRMPEMTGLEMCQKLQNQGIETPIILITAFGSFESAIEAIRAGAFDYIVKPFQLAEMSVTVERALKFRRLERDNAVLRSELRGQHSFANIIGKSAGMKQVFDLIQRVSQATANVLITGESGTGKERVARAIHDLGPRAKHPFIAINCTAIPETLLESELFGHAKGSFTGAIHRKRGLFEEANGGTVFLDEIGDMDQALQAKLLRVIQERKIRAVGDTIDRDIDVRIIAATHKDLKAAIKDGRFREDLYYRLSVIPILIPPLRHRREDIPLLAETFLRKYVAANGSRVRGFTRAAIARLMAMEWEGNVRELENLIERAVVLCRGDMIDEIDLPAPSTMDVESIFAQATEQMPTIDELERRYMKFVLEKTGGRKEKAAHILGINRRTLYRKEKEFGFSTSAHDEHDEQEHHGDHEIQDDRRSHVD